MKIIRGMKVINMVDKAVIQVIALDMVKWDMITIK